MENSIVVAKVFRLWPGKDKEPHYDTYEVQYQQGLTALGLLRYIYRTLDPSLAFRDFQCGVGICGTCRLSINGATKKSCITLVEPGETVTIEPSSMRKVIRDLVTIPD